MDIVSLVGREPVKRPAGDLLRVAFFLLRQSKGSER